MKESYKKGDSDSILALSLAGGIARGRLKRRQVYRWAGLLSFEKRKIRTWGALGGEGAASKRQRASLATNDLIQAQGDPCRIPPPFGLQLIRATSQLLPQSSNHFGLPSNGGGSTPASPFSGPARRSLTLWPARSPVCLCDPSTAEASAVSLPPLSGPAPFTAHPVSALYA